MVSREELRFVEEMGALFEQTGSTRMAGRVWAYLLIADAEQVSSSDLAEALDAAGSSISSATRLLESFEMVDRIRMPGDRKDYFTIHHGAVLNLVRRRFEAVVSARDLAVRALRAFGDRAIARPHLEELYEVYSWFGRELPALIDRFQLEQETGPVER
jgi:DNA-binding transcriptional regulator GbsR (MarR family)